MKTLSLGNDVIRENTGERVFDVNINGMTVLDRFCIADECGTQRAVIKKFTIDINNGEGLSVDFHAHSGKCILNAIRIYKCM